MYGLYAAEIDFSTHLHPEDPTMVRTACRLIFEAAADHPAYRGAILQLPTEIKLAQRTALLSAWPVPKIAPLPQPSSKTKTNVNFSDTGQASFVDLPQNLNDAQTHIAQMAGTFRRMAKCQNACFLTYDNWRSFTLGNLVDKHDHHFAVLNQIFGSNGSIWWHANGHSQVDEGDQFFMKAGVMHEAETMTAANVHIPRKSLILRPSDLEILLPA